MSSRPSLGVPPRPPQRTLSGTGLSQRPPQARTLSQQYLPPSPIRKEAIFDFSTPEPSDGGQRSGSSGFRRAGSRLKLELSSEGTAIAPPASVVGSPAALDSSQVITPSRLMTATDASEIGDVSSRASTPGFSSDRDPARLPMPQRRKRFALPCAQRRVLRCSTPATPNKKDTRPQPWSVEVPADAPRYRISTTKQENQNKGGSLCPSAKGACKPSNGFGDFFPWSGGHPEDQFSENIIRSGFFDKAPVSSTETSSAKTALSQVLKSKAHLGYLSNIFTNVLGQRKLSGQVDIESTFKLPPRVTVTETKREGWLKDLANPDIAIKRLNRTIPHGIKGKVLLEQCLDKNVPLERAVWLARCVGAQEMRTFKRKGVNNTVVLGGEAKWVKEWTVCVEQFLETRISALSEPGWKAKVRYAICLAANLFAEHLLDREHYMDWLITNLETSSQLKLPMWLVIAQIYWKDILSMRRFGRRLVGALLCHHHAIQNSPDQDLLFPLSSVLTTMVMDLLANFPCSFISPATWSKYQDAVRSTLPPDNTRLQMAYKSITDRNEQLAATTVQSHPAVHNVLVRLLDSTLQTPAPSDICMRCWSVGSDKGALIKTLFEWCTSPYRPGPCKIYVAARLLGAWSRLGVDVTQSTLEFLDASVSTEIECKNSIYHLVSELMRVGQFSMSQYGQWLISRGGLSGPDDVAIEAGASTRLIVELPTYSMSESLASLRASILRRARFEIEEEEQDIRMAIRHIRHALGLELAAGDPLRDRKPVAISKLCARVRMSSRTLKAAVGAWLNSEVSCTEHEMQGGQSSLTISSSGFNAIRSLLESAEDFTMFASVLKVVTRISHVDVLASCADTLNFHLPTFSAIGVAGELFDCLHMKYRVMFEEQGNSIRPLLVSLAGLAPRLPGLSNIGAQLEKDKYRNDKSTAVDACSPVSDNMTTRLQDSEGELHEEIDKLLSTGTSMDRPTMERLFGTIADRLQSCWSKEDGRQRDYAVLLARLRLFDSQYYDNIMVKWLQRVRASTDRPSITYIYPMLVICECLSLSIILATACDPSLSRTTASVKTGGVAASSTTLVQVTWRSRYVQEVLQLLVTPLKQHPLLTDEECYRFTMTFAVSRKHHLNEILWVVRTALAEYSLGRQNQDQVSELPLDVAATQQSFLQMLQSLVIMDSPAVADALTVKDADPAVANLIEATTTKLLAPSSPDGTRISFDQVLELANDLTLPFCQLKLSSSFAVGETAGPESSERMQEQLDVFSAAMDRAMEAGNITWTGMLSCLGPEITQQLKNTAQARFFDMFPSVKASDSPAAERSLEQMVRTAESLLSVVNAIVRGGAMGRPPQLVSAMVEKLSDVLTLLAGDDVMVKSSVTEYWLPFMLTFITLHTAKFDTSKASNEIRGRALLTLMGILLELDSLAIATTAHERLKQRVFDLSLVLVDSLAEEVRQQCAKILCEVTSDRRIRYVFSFAASSTERFMLAHQERSASGIRPGFLGVAGMWAPPPTERLSKFAFRRWESISDLHSKPEDFNDSSVNLSLFEAIRV